METREVFQWEGESVDMTMPEYMQASGDTMYYMSSTYKLLEFDF